VTSDAYVKKRGFVKRKEAHISNIYYLKEENYEHAS